LPAFETQQEFRKTMRKRVYEEQGLLLKPEAGTPARDQAQHSIICGSPETVAEEIMIKAWTTENYRHKGKYWDIQLPKLRPQPYTKPHPPIVRACSGEESVLGMAREGRPFLMNIQTNEVTRTRMDLYRKTMRESGHDEATVTRCVEDTWLWRNIFVAETDAEARRLALPAFETQQEFRKTMRKRVYEEQGLLLKQEAGTPARDQAQHSFICGSPATVAEEIAKIDSIGVGGLLMVFRLGPMPYEVAESSIRLFMSKVAPQFASKKAVSAF